MHRTAQLLVLTLVVSICSTAAAEWRKSTKEGWIRWHEDGKHLYSLNIETQGVLRVVVKEGKKTYEKGTFKDLPVKAVRELATAIKQWKETTGAGNTGKPERPGPAQSVAELDEAAKLHAAARRKLHAAAAELVKKPIVTETTYSEFGADTESGVRASPVMLGLFLFPHTKGQEFTGRVWLKTWKESNGNVVHTVYSGAYAFGFYNRYREMPPSITCRIERVFTATGANPAQKDWNQETIPQEYERLEISLIFDKERDIADGGELTVMRPHFVVNDHRGSLGLPVGDGIDAKMEFPVKFGKLPIDGVPKEYLDDWAKTIEFEDD